LQGLLQDFESNLNACQDITEYLQTMIYLPFRLIFIPYVQLSACLDKDRGKLLCAAVSYSSQKVAYQSGMG
jgi:hypothetical protein